VKRNKRKRKKREGKIVSVEGKLVKMNEKIVHDLIDVV